MTAKKSYDAQFKTNVAFEAIKGEKTYVEIAAAHNIPKTNVKEWHDKLEASTADSSCKCNLPYYIIIPILFSNN